jgi:cell division initiation protein
MKPEEPRLRDFTHSIRGYDREEVDAYIRQLTEEISSLKERLAGAEAGTTPAPRQEAKSAYMEVGQETSKILVAAQEAAEEIRARARAQAAELVAEGRSKAEELARVTHAERQHAEEDLRILREARGTLATQLEDVRRRIDETVSRLRAPVEAATAGPPAPPTPVSVAASSPAEEPASGSPDEREVDLKRAIEGARKDREEGRRQVEQALEEAPEGETTLSPENEALQKRRDALGDTPKSAARRLKRVLQEDQNQLLDRLRTQKGKGALHQNVPSLEDQIVRLVRGLGETLGDAFRAGRKVAGADVGDPDQAVRDLITRQVVHPLRNELEREVDSGLTAQDTPTSIADRAGDIFRVWKGVRSQLLGEGLVYAAFHQGLTDAWRDQQVPGKRWVVSPDETQCPNNVCQQNADAANVGLTGRFPSGHFAPPGHGGCTCTLLPKEA